MPVLRRVLVRPRDAEMWRGEQRRSKKRRPGWREKEAMEKKLGMRRRKIGWQVGRAEWERGKDGKREGGKVDGKEMPAASV